MAIKFNRSQTFPTNGTVTAAGLHNLIDGTDIYQALITDQTELTSVGTGDYLLIADSDLSAGDAPRKTTVQNLFDDVLSAGTFSDINSTGNITTATLTANKTLSTSASFTTSTLGAATATSATITTGTIPNATLGTTTSTAATITNGTVTNLNSTTGTIGSLTTTLAGDFTISQGTGTLGTSGVTAGTYGTSTIVPQIVVDAKGRVTSVGTSAVSSGKVLQVVSTQITAPTTVSVTTAGTFYDISGFSASITPSSSSNYILIMMMLNSGRASSGYASVFRLMRDSTPIGIGDAGGASQPRVTTGVFPFASNDDLMGFPVIWYDNPSSTSSITYKLQVTNNIGPSTAYLNRSITDGNVVGNSRYASQIILMEIAP